MESTAEQLTLFSQETLASLTVVPGSEKARKMTAFSGQKLTGSLMKLNLAGLCAKMLLETSHWGSMECYLTWKIAHTPQRRLYFLLSRSEPNTRDTGFLFWPTPVASQDYKPIRPLTPSERNGTHGKSIVGAIGDRYPELIGAYLDPQFQETLMGFPIGWTDVGP